MVYNPLPPRADLPPDRHRPPRPAAASGARYLAGIYDLDGLGTRLRRQADAVGLYRAGRVIAQTDGGYGPEPMLRRDFPTTELILDFWRASEHLSGLAKLYAGPTPGTADAPMHLRCHRRKQEEGAAILTTHRYRLPVPRDTAAQWIGRHPDRGGDNVDEDRARRGVTAIAGMLNWARYEDAREGRAQEVRFSQVLNTIDTAEEGEARYTIGGIGSPFIGHCDGRVARRTGIAGRRTR
jgi:hypothetical protein